MFMIFIWMSLSGVIINIVMADPSTQKGCILKGLLPYYFSRIFNGYRKENIFKRSTHIGNFCRNGVGSRLNGRLLSGPFIHWVRVADPWAGSQTFGPCWFLVYGRDTRRSSDRPKIHDKDAKWRNKNGEENCLFISDHLNSNINQR